MPISAAMTPRARMLRACRGESTDRPPVWLMRQAGRYLPEYREIKARMSFLEMCEDPGVATELALQPYRRFGVDAVIVFSDILLPLAGLDLELDFRPAPRISSPIRRREELWRLKGDATRALQPTCEAIRRLKAELGEHAAVVGFAGAPWTLAAYACEESVSRNPGALAALSYRDPELVDGLLARMVEITTEALRVQQAAGADVLQIFDTWAGCLARERFERLAGAALREVLAALPQPHPPVIVFARDAADLLEALADLGGVVVSLDWRMDLGEAAARIGDRVSLQGNLDPVALMAPASEITRSVDRLIQQGRKARGHILNLGHGVLPTTPIEGVSAFVEGARRGAGAS